MFFLFAQHDDIVVQRGHGGFLRTEHTVVAVQRTVEEHAFLLVVLHFRAAGEAQAAVRTGKGVVFVEDDIHVNVRVGVGKVDRAFQLERTAFMELEAVDDPALSLQMGT